LSHNPVTAYQLIIINAFFRQGEAKFAGLNVQDPFKVYDMIKPIAGEMEIFDPI